MARVDDRAGLARDIATLRALIDRFLDEGTSPDDPALVAASLVLKAKVADLQSQMPEQSP
jgi:hypothetical protein